MVSFGKVQPLSHGVWTAPLGLQELSHLPGAPVRVDGRHIVLVRQAEVGASELKAPIASLQVLGIGSINEALFVETDVGAGEAEATKSEQRQDVPSEIARGAAPLTTASQEPLQGNGDRLFIAELGKVDSELQRVGRALITRIRETYPGDLIKTESPRKFVEFPDNYWAAEIQNRKMMIKFIIRSQKQRLYNSGIEFHSERPPAYFYIKVSCDNDIETALHFLSLADKK